MFVSLERSAAPSLLAFLPSVIGLLPVPEGIYSIPEGIMPIHKKGWKENLGNYRPVSLTWVPSRIMEQIILGAITQHLQEGWGIRPSQCGFMGGRS